MTPRPGDPYRPGPIRGSVSDAEGGSFDAVIIGGGIYGVCAALGVGLRGRRALMLERDDFGGGVSWASHRIIHGGLRYLQSLDLVRFVESVRERRWFMDTLPGLIQPMDCLVPLYGHGLKRPVFFRAAATLNNALTVAVGGATPRLGRAHAVAPETVLDQFAAVRREGLLGGGAWQDGRMRSSERVLMCLLRAACDLGCTAVARCDVREVVIRSGRVSGVVALDHRTGKRFSVSSPVVINASGPASQIVASEAGSPGAGLFTPARAFNLLLNLPLPARRAIAVSAVGPGVPTLFLVPDGPMTAAGTWHEPTDPEHPEAMPPRASVERFLDEIGRAVPGFSPGIRDVACIWSGLLPAARLGEAEPSDRPRVVDHGRIGGAIGLYSVSGVKYTTARLVTDRLLTRVFGPARRDVPVIADPLEPAGAPPTGTQSEIGALIDALRSQEAAESIDDILLRRTPWYTFADGARAAAASIGTPFGLDGAESVREVARVLGSIASGAPPEAWAQSRTA